MGATGERASDKLVSARWIEGGAVFRDAATPAPEWETVQWFNSPPLTLAELERVLPLAFNGIG
jgi:hypothetical protein